MVGQIEAFVKVAREGSFTKAAGSLNLSQPSISTRIAGLEANLDCKLFIRSGRRLSLTPIGDAFLPYAEKAILTLQDGQQTVSDFTSGKRGHVSIVTLDTLAMSILPKPMRRFRSEYPEVDFTVHLSIQREILGLLYDGKTHLGLIRGPLWDRGIEVLSRFEEPIRAVSNPHHAFAKQRKIPLADVLNFPIYRIPIDAATMAFIEHLTEQTWSRNQGSQIWFPAVMAIPILLNGEDLAFLPESFVTDILVSGDLVILDIADLPALNHELLLVKLTGQKLDNLHKEFVKMIRAQWRKIRVD